MLTCPGDAELTSKVSLKKPAEASLPLGPTCVWLSPRYVTGWFSHYHRRRKLIHPVMIQHIQPQALRYPRHPCPHPQRAPSATHGSAVAIGS